MKGESVRRSNRRSLLWCAIVACLLLGFFNVAAEAAGGHKTRAQSSQAAHSARKKNEGAAEASAEKRRVAQAQLARNARQKTESNQKRTRDGKLRKEAAAQKKIADDAAAVAKAKKSVADRKFQREEQTRKAKVEQQRKVKVAAELKAAVEEEDRLRKVAEEEAALYEARRKEVASAVEERQRLIARVNKLQQERQTKINSERRAGSAKPANMTGSKMVTTDASQDQRREDAAISSDMVAPSGYCDRDGTCEEGGEETKEVGSRAGGGGVWRADDSSVDSVQAQRTIEARERAAHSEKAQKYLEARQAQANAKIIEQKRNEAAAAAMNSDRTRAKRQVAAHAAAAAATVAAKAVAAKAAAEKVAAQAAAAKSEKQKIGNAHSSPTQLPAASAAEEDRRRRKRSSDQTKREVLEAAARNARLQKAKETFEANKKIAAKILAAEKAEAAKVAAAAAAAVEKLCTVELPDFTELICNSHSACGVLGYCTSLHQCSDRRRCTHSPGFPEDNPVDSGCPPTNLAAYTMPCVTKTSNSEPRHQESEKHGGQATNAGTPRKESKPDIFSIASLANEDAIAGQSQDGILSSDMVPGPSVRQVVVALRDGNIDEISFVYIDGSEASWKPSTLANTPASTKVKVRDGVQTFLIAQDQYVTRIKAKVGSTLAGLQIVTSDGQTSPWFGGFDGKHKSFSAPSGREIWALNRDGSGSNSMLFVNIRTRVIVSAAV